MRDGSKKTAQDKRADRLAEALRENLKRRKAQSRKRRDTAPAEDSPAETPDAGSREAEE
ncbi:MAG: hypothetical protein AAGD13_13470 [Pseudomonadota bacterium]